MRWCVSIGVVFAAGVIAGGEVPGLAAPSAPSSPVAAEAKVDVELILAVDVSYSMDMDDFLCNLLPDQQGVEVPQLNVLAFTAMSWGILGLNQDVADIRDWFPSDA